MSCIHAGVLSGRPGGDADHLLTSAAQSDSGAQARYDVEIAAAVLSPQRSEYVDPPVRKREVRREYADDLVVRAVDGDSLADDARVSTKAALPETMAQDSEPRAGGAILFSSQAASQNWLNSENAEEIGCHVRAGNLDRLFTAQ